MSIHHSHSVNPDETPVSLPLANRGARFELSEYFDNKAQFDSTIPAGNYVVTMTTLNDGVKTCALTLGPDAYPNAPLILSTNEAARARNARTAAEASDLKEGLEMVEEKARSELGMVKPDEILVQITAPKR
mgnify:CR=1 FL=1